MSGFSNTPKILRGAFVEYGLSIPPLFVVFQFNPVQLSRSHSQSFSVPGSVQRAEFEAAREAGRESRWMTLRDYHQRFDDLTELRDAQQVRLQPESISALVEEVFSAIHENIKRSITTCSSRRVTIGSSPTSATCWEPTKGAGTESPLYRRKSAHLSAVAVGIHAASRRLCDSTKQLAQRGIPINN